MGVSILNATQRAAVVEMLFYSFAPTLDYNRSTEPCERARTVGREPNRRRAFKVLAGVLAAALLEL